MFPTHRTDLLDTVGQLEILLALRVLQEFGQDASVVVDNAVGQESRALAPKNGKCPKCGKKFGQSDLVAQPQS